MTMDELTGNFKTYEIKKKQDKSKGEHKKEKNLVLKAAKENITIEDEETTYITKRFLKVLKRMRALPKRI